MCLLILHALMVWCVCIIVNNRNKKLKVSLTVAQEPITKDPYLLLLDRIFRSTG